MSEILNKKDGWHGNNLHIDEIVYSKTECTREVWIDVSFSLMKLLVEQVQIPKHQMIFMHYDLKDSSNKVHIKHLDLDWFQNKIDIFTPPSLNVTSDEYFESFYKSELISILQGKSIINKLGSLADKIAFFHRTYFNEIDRTNSNEIYMFVKNGITLVS